MKSFLYNINTIDEDTNMTVQLIHATLGETKHQISQTGSWWIPNKILLHITILKKHIENDVFFFINYTCYLPSLVSDWRYVSCGVPFCPSCGWLDNRLVCRPATSQTPQVK